MKNLKATLITLVAAITMLSAGLATAQELAYHEAAGSTGTLDEGWIRGPEGPMWAKFEWIDGKAVFQGDMVVDVLNAAGSNVGPTIGAINSAIIDEPLKTWPDGVIPYEIAISGSAGSQVRDAISHWNGRTAQTGLRLVQHTTQTDYVRFVPAGGICRSNVGRYTGTAAQEIELDPRCSVGAIIHEIGHTAGLWHEQSRHDRDDYVTIVWSNIETLKEGNFEKYPEGWGIDSGPYDYGSIMHYGAYDFSKNGQKTILVKNGNAAIGQRDGLSQGDIAGVAALYGGVVDHSQLENGVPVRNLAGATHAELVYRLDVPAGMSKLTFETNAGSGDVDLYVKRGSVPSTSNHDCFGESQTNNESCIVDSPPAGTWYVKLFGYRAFSGVTLVGTYHGEPPQGGSEWTGYSSFKSSTKKVASVTSEGPSSMEISNGRFSYVAPDGTLLTGSISQDGKKLYVNLDSRSITALEEQYTDMVWFAMNYFDVDPHFVNVSIDSSSIKLKAKLKLGKKGKPSCIKMTLSYKAWVETGISSSRGKLKAKMTLYED